MSYGMSPIVRALCEHALPHLTRELRPLALVTNRYWGMVVPINGEPTICQVANSSTPPQFPNDGVANAFPVPAEREVPVPENEEPEA
eukprot:27166-Amphidinium_carterae.2